MSDTELWLIDLAHAAAALEAAESGTPRLSDETRHRLSSMRDDEARHERRLAHVALRILLERARGPALRGVPFSFGPKGKPFLDAGPGAQRVSFSLAHTRGVALIAVGGPGPLGVDIERDRAVRIPAARRAPIEAEAVALAGGAALSGNDGSDARFLCAWVRIEAVAKATGLGVGSLLERLRPATAAAPRDGRQTEAAEAPVCAFDIPLPPGLHAAIALPTGARPPSWQPFPGDAAAINALMAHPQ